MTMIGLVFGSEFWNIINFKIRSLRSYTGKSKNTKRTRMSHLGFGNHLVVQGCTFNHIFILYFPFPLLFASTIC